MDIELNITTCNELVPPGVPEQKKEHHSQTSSLQGWVVRLDNSCDFCGRLAKRVRGVAICPTCSGGW